MTNDLLRRLFETAPDPTGFDASAPGYREAWQAVERHLTCPNCADRAESGMEH